MNRTRIAWVLALGLATGWTAASASRSNAIQTEALVRSETAWLQSSTTTHELVATGNRLDVVLETLKPELPGIEEVLNRHREIYPLGIWRSSVAPDAPLAYPEQVDG
jgi:hypothetical protein